MDAGEPAMLARPRLGSDEGVGSAEDWRDQLGARVAEQVGRIVGRVLGVRLGRCGVGGDDVVDRRVARAVRPGAGVGVLEAEGVGEVAGDGKRRGVGVVPVAEIVQPAGVGWVGKDEADAGGSGLMRDDAPKIGGVDRGLASEGRAEDRLAGARATARSVKMDLFPGQAGGTWPRLGTAGSDCGADANLVEAGVGLLAAGEGTMVGQLCLCRAALPGPVGVDSQVPGDRDQPGPG